MRAAASPPPRHRRPPVEAPPAARGRRVLAWLVLFLACVLMVNAVIGDRGLLDTLRARREYEELSASIARLRHENARLRSEARRLQEDPDAIEDLARRELGLIRPGETLFIIRDRQPAPPRPR
jgi:cell division protein FtsB